MPKTSGEEAVEGLKVVSASSRLSLKSLNWGHWSSLLWTVLPLLHVAAPHGSFAYPPCTVEVEDQAERQNAHHGVYLKVPGETRERLHFF